MAQTCYFIIFILLQIVALGYGERTKDKMYEHIYGANGCYRRLNSTHQTGCSSKRGGSTGVIHYCSTIENLDFILQNGTAAPYIPVIPTRLFTVDTVEKLIDSSKVSGLVVHPNNETLSHFTHENQCPNPQSSLEDTCKKDSVWNPYGTGLLYFDIPFPVFYVESGREILKMQKCFVRFNNFSYDNQADRSLCALELKSFMFATTNTQTCRRRSNIITNLNPIKFCEPLGDYNIWAALFPLARGPKRNETKPVLDYKYVVIAARMDTTSMFEKTSGANNPVTGIVTLLYTAKLLKTMLKDGGEDVKTNVLFILFNGETYDYLGSQRLLYDMQKGDFPVKDLKPDNDFLPIIKPENISLFIEISQLGNSNGKKLFVHHLGDNDKVTQFYQKLTSNEGFAILRDVSGSLPPSSLHTFLKNYTDFPGLVIADHEKSYTNPFYNSVYDNASNIDFTYYNATKNKNVVIPNDSIQQFIANISEMIARSVYEEIKNETYKSDLPLDVILVDELFHCYLENLNCTVHSAVQKNIYPKAPGSLYVGVDHITNFVTKMTSKTLGWLTGDVEGKGDINCTNTPENYAFRYYNMSKSITELNVTLCYKITMNRTEAVSPAFIIDDYDWSSGQYSTWTESTWSDMNVQIFLKPSSAHEKMTIAIGSMSLIFSFLLVYFMKSRSHILFMPPLPSEAPTDC